MISPNPRHALARLLLCHGPCRRIALLVGLDTAETA